MVIQTTLATSRKHASISTSVFNNLAGMQWCRSQQHAVIFLTRFRIKSATSMGNNSSGNDDGAEKAAWSKYGPTTYGAPRRRPLPIVVGDLIVSS